MSARQGRIPKLAPREPTPDLQPGPQVSADRHLRVIPSEAEPVGTSADSQLLAARDDAAWRACYAEHRDRVYGIVMNMVRDRDLADDLSQEVWILVFRKIDQYRGTSPLSSWLAVIALNVVRGHFRRNQPDLVELPETLAGRASGERGLVEHMWLTKAIRTLPVKQREVVALRQYGFSFKEVADVLEIPSATARSHYLRAIRGLQALAGRHAKDGTSGKGGER